MRADHRSPLKRGIPGAQGKSLAKLRPDPDFPTRAYSTSEGHFLEGCVAERPTKPPRGHRTRSRNVRVSTRVASGLSTVYAPRELGSAGRRAWHLARRSAPWLDGGGDELLLLRFAALHDERANLEAEIAEHGRFTVGSMGQQVEHPAVRMLVSVDERTLKLANALGLGPVARRRLTGRFEAPREQPALASVTDLYGQAVGESS